MAKIKSPYGCTDISGSIAGTTYARSRSGFYAQAKGRPTGTVTHWQSVQRSAFHQVIAALQTLTRDELDAWDQYAHDCPCVAGDPRMVTFCMAAVFARLNLGRIRAGLKILRRPPLGCKSDYFSKFAVRRTEMGIVGRPTNMPFRQQRFLYGRGVTGESFGRVSRRFRWKETHYMSEHDVWPAVVWHPKDFKPVPARYPFRYKCMDAFGRATTWTYSFFDILLGDLP